MRPSPAASRDRGLRRLGMLNRWLVAGALVLSGLFTAVAALAKPGSAKRSAAATAPSAAPAPVTPAPASTDATPAPAAPETAQPVPPDAVPQAVPVPGGPAVSSGGS